LTVSTAADTDRLNARSSVVGRGDAVIAGAAITDAGMAVTEVCSIYCRLLFLSAGGKTV
jgi:hypothetical protein